MAEQDRFDALLRKGAALRRQGKPAEALLVYWQALAINPAPEEAWIETASTLHLLQRRDEAVTVLRTVLERWPRSARAWFTAASIGGQREAAEAALRRALALAGREPAILERLGLNLSARDPEQALEIYQNLRELHPELASGHRGAGEVVLRLGKLQEAEPMLIQALELEVGDSTAHGIMARLCLRRGQAKAGWWHLAQMRPGPAGGHEWDGTDPAGKSIAVIADGGLEDALPLFGLVSVLAEKGAVVTVILPPAWVSLLDGLAGAASLHPSDKGPIECDETIALSRLPWRLQLTETALPPYKITPRAGFSLSVPLGTRLKVGLLWASGGKDYERSVEFAALLPLTGLNGATFFGLQTGPRASDIKKSADPALVIDLSPQLQTLADLAAVVAQLDLVITVEGPMVPLARAVGTKLWLLQSRYPDARWPFEGSSGITLFRQEQRDDWTLPVREMHDELVDLLTKQPVNDALTKDIVVDSIFPKAEGQPRFRMTAPRRYLADPGIRFLVSRERSGVGYEFATRSFLDAHLEPGDLFIDIGAHWGIMSLQAATRWPGEVRVLAVEPSPHNLPFLERWLTANGVAEQVEIVAAFAADAPGQGHLKPQSTMGHSLIRAEDGTIPVVTIDSVMMDRTVLFDSRRIIVKIDVEGHEPEVIDGMTDLLASGKVAAVIWERGREYNSAAGQERLAALRRKFAALDFSAWRFESEDEAGPLVPFVEDGRLGNVFELSATAPPNPAYGSERPKPVAQPLDVALDAALQARTLFARGLESHRAGKTAEAREFYRRAAALDGTQSGPYNNLGALLRTQGSRHAAAASFQRALRLSPEDVGIISNFSNALREIGAFTECERLLRRALVQKPNDAGMIYNLGVLRKDTERPEDAVILFERALSLSPNDPEYRCDRALAMLQSGDYPSGFAAYEARWGLKRATKRKIPLPLWDGAPLDGRSIFLSDEQGFGDVLQWARFIAPLKGLGAGRIIMECQPELMRLMSLIPEVDAVVPRAKAVPDCDLTLPLLSLPRVFRTNLESLPAAVPYLPVPEPSYQLSDDGRLKLGIVWAGKPTPRDRSIGLETLLPLLGDPRLAAFSLQMGPRTTDIAKLGAELLLTDLAPTLTDFAETAAIVNQLDLLITVDTAIAHLAGALGVKTFLLLRKVSDWRWFDQRENSPWYPTMTLFRQHELDRWDVPLEGLRISIERELTGFSGDRSERMDQGNGGCLVWSVVR